jgi:uncharacterized protein YciI
MRQSKLCLFAGLALALVPVHAAPQPEPAPSPAATPAPAPAATTDAKPQAFLAVYERGPAWNDDKGTMEQAGIDEHIKYLRANSRQLLAAGRFEDANLAAGDRAVGVVVVGAANRAEAAAFFAADPAITGNLMTVTVRHWLIGVMRAY